MADNQKQWNENQGQDQGNRPGSQEQPGQSQNPKPGHPDQSRGTERPMNDPTRGRQGDKFEENLPGHQGGQTGQNPGSKPDQNR